MLFRRHFAADPDVASWRTASGTRTFQGHAGAPHSGWDFLLSVGRGIAQSKHWLQSFQVTDATTNRAACRTAFAGSPYLLRLPTLAQAVDGRPTLTRRPQG